MDSSGGFRSDMPNPMIFNKMSCDATGEAPEESCNRPAPQRAAHVGLRRMGSLHILRALSPGTKVPSD